MKFRIIAGYALLVSCLLIISISVTGCKKDELREPDTAELTGSDVSETHGSDVTASPDPDVAENPGSDVSASPGPDVAEETDSNVSASPGSDETPASASDSPSSEKNIIKDSDYMNEITDFSISKITDEIFSRIYGHSYPKDCTLDLEELRYLTVLHCGFDGEAHVGELIVNRKIASATLEIFEELYAIEYPIEKIVLIDEYNADDEASMEDNNSSAFNYRYIAETTVLSNHAMGFAIDINTLYNPYVYTRKDGSAFLQPVNAGDYVDRDTDCPYYIRKDDACYEIFTSHGFSWGGDWETKKDYQHFEYKQ